VHDLVLEAWGKSLMFRGRHQVKLKKEVRNLAEIALRKEAKRLGIPLRKAFAYYDENGDLQIIEKDSVHSDVVGMTGLIGYIARIQPGSPAEFAKSRL